MSETPSESALLNYIRMTERRPGMYFGSHHVDVVKHHLDGWRAHRQAFEDDDAFADFFFENFHSFVETHYPDTRTVGWNGLIRDNTQSEEDGFKMFISLLEKFATRFATDAI